jgi:hypothetical protein
MRPARLLLLLLALSFTFGQARASRPVIGPFRIAGADSASWLSFKLAAQIRLDFVSEDDASCDCGGRTNTLTMKARRIRPTIGISLPRQRLSLKLHLSTAPGSVELMDFYFNYKAAENLQVRAGQYKVPFTRYRIQSFQRLTFADWAIVAPAFGAERQMGVALHNGYEKPARYAYAFGIFSGQNARASHAVTLPKLYGIDTGNPSDLSDPAPREDFHPELVLHLAYNPQGMNVQTDTDEEGEGFRYSTVLSAAWDLDPRYRQDFILRLAPEFLLKYRGLSASAIGYAGWAETGNSRATELVMTGGLIQSAYRICKTYEVSGRYAVVDLVDTVFLEEEIRAGLNVYIIEHQLKWQSDFGRIENKRTDARSVDYIVRSQLQLAF